MSKPQLDNERYIRLDDEELQTEVTTAIAERWVRIETDNFHDRSN